MMPSVALVLNGLARTMLMDLLQTTHAYAAQTLQLSAALTMMCAQEFDRAAARLVEENRALAQLFADAAPIVTDTALRADLQSAQADAPTLLVSALQEHNRALRGLLVRPCASSDDSAGAHTDNAGEANPAPRTGISTTCPEAS
jgi:hypothetical protein